MKTIFTHQRFAFLLILILVAGTNVFAQLPVKQVKNNITKNTTWNSNNIYYLKNKIYVTNGATLTIKPGTIITGDTISKGSLIITRGAKINAVGTACKPIVFTSPRKPGLKKRGDWGGLIILGYARLNTPGDTAHIEGLPVVPETLYGGGKNPNCGGGNCPNDADNSGQLRYVRVEFAGVALAPNNEINGITFGGVGSGTTVDHIQVSYSNDDSFEWFGGKVNGKYLVAFRGLDDDFDTDLGYSGKNQFLAAIRDPKIADISGSNGFESDNDANGSLNAPLTNAVFSNVTVDAGKDTTQNINYKRAAHIRRSSHLNIYNSILMGFPEGVLIDGATTQNNVLTGDMFANNIVAATQSNNWITTTPENATVENLLRTGAANSFFTGNAGVKLQAPYTLANPKLYPKAGSPALSGASFSHAALNDPFFTVVNYRGAFRQGAANDWTVGWTNWDPVNTDYSKGVPSNCDAIASDEEETEQPAAAIASVDALVSPNPNNGNFKIALSGFNAGKVNIKVSDLNSGATVYSGKVNSNTANSIRINAKPGVYVVELNDGVNVITRKINVVQ